MMESYCPYLRRSRRRAEMQVVTMNCEKSVEVIVLKPLCLLGRTESCNVIVNDCYLLESFVVRCSEEAL